MNKFIAFFLLLMSVHMYGSDEKTDDSGTKKLGWRDLFYASKQQAKGTITPEQLAFLKHREESIAQGLKSSGLTDSCDGIKLEVSSKTLKKGILSQESFADDLSLFLSSEEDQG